MARAILPLLLRVGPACCDGSIYGHSGWGSPHQVETISPGASGLAVVRSMG